MSEGQSPSGTSPSLPPTLTPLRRPEDDHAPSISSPLNPDAARGRLPIPAKAPIVREQREKKDSLKKRESYATTRGATPDIKQSARDATIKAITATGASGEITIPMRYSLHAPELAHYNAPRNPGFASHEPNPLFAPDGKTELRKPVEQLVSLICGRC
jgi:COMPASS component BRE2